MGIHQPEYQAVASPVLTIRIACGDEFFSCWRFLISNNILNDLLASPPCFVQEEKLVVFDNQFDLLPFMLLKQYLTTGKFKISKTKVTAECISQLEDMMSWICPDIQLEETSNTRKSVKESTSPKMKISGIESFEGFSSSDEVDTAALKVELFDDQSNNNTVEELNESYPPNPKQLMKCDICGWAKHYIQEWRFRKHVEMCKKKFDQEESLNDGDEEEKVLECILCSKLQKNPSTYKRHMIISHFHKEIKGRFLVPTGDHKNQIKKCQECDYKTSVTGSLVIHYGIKHNKLFEVAPQKVLDSIPEPHKPGKKKRKLRYSSSSTLKSGSSPSACTVGFEKEEESDISEIFKKEEVVSDDEN